MNNMNIEGRGVTVITVSVRWLPLSLCHLNSLWEIPYRFGWNQYETRTWLIAQTNPL